MNRIPTRAEALAESERIQERTRMEYKKIFGHEMPEPNRYTWQDNLLMLIACILFVGFWYFVGYGIYHLLGEL